MKSFKQLRSEGKVWDTVRDLTRMGGKMVGQLLKPSIHQPAPVIDMRTNRKKATTDPNAVNLRHRTREDMTISFTGPTAQQQANDYMRRNRDYFIYESDTLTAAQKLVLMGDKRRADTLAALARLKQVGDVNRLSNRHRTLVTNFLTRTGGLDNITGAIARKTLSMYRKMGNRENV